MKLNWSASSFYKVVTVTVSRSIVTFMFIILLATAVGIIFCLTTRGLREGYHLAMSPSLARFIFRALLTALAGMYCAFWLEADVYYRSMQPWVGMHEVAKSASENIQPSLHHCLHKGTTQEQLESSVLLSSVAGSECASNLGIGSFFGQHRQTRSGNHHHIYSNLLRSDRLHIYILHLYTSHLAIRQVSFSSTNHGLHHWRYDPLHQEHTRKREFQINQSNGDEERGGEPVCTLQVRLGGGYHYSHRSWICRLLGTEWDVVLGPMVCVGQRWDSVLCVVMIDYVLFVRDNIFVKLSI